MRFATIISLLNFACAACALQLHHVERRASGFRASVIRHRSFRPTSRRRIASRSSIVPYIVPRGNPICSPQKSLDAILQAKEKKHIIELHTSPADDVKVYRVKYPCSYDGKSAVVKEIRLTPEGWTEIHLKIEISRISYKGELFGALFVGETCFVIMENLGDKWKPGSSPHGLEADKLMTAVNERDKKIFALEREYVCRICLGLSMTSPFSGPSLFSDYTWTLSGNSWVVRSVGKWRKARARFTGNPHKPVVHYCGITGWITARDGSYLPVFYNGLTVH